MLPVLILVLIMILFNYSQADYANYGIDWQGPVPDPSPDYVDVPDTTCPFTEEEMHTLPTTEDLTYVEGVEAFSYITSLI